MPTSRRSFLRSLVTGAAALVAGAVVAKEAIFLPHTPKVIPPIEPVVKVPQGVPKVSVTNANKLMADMERMLENMGHEHDNQIVLYMNSKAEEQFKGILSRLQNT